MPESDAGFEEVVGGHFDIHLVADTDANKVLTHFAGDVSQHLMTVR